MFKTSEYAGERHLINPPANSGRQRDPIYLWRRLNHYSSAKLEDSELSRLLELGLMLSFVNKICEANTQTCSECNKTSEAMSQIDIYSILALFTGLGVKCLENHVPNVKFFDIFMVIKQVYLQSFDIFLASSIISKK